MRMTYLAHLKPRQELANKSRHSFLKWFPILYTIKFIHFISDVLHSHIEM